MDWDNRVKGAVLGHAVGDALGVPVEFISRSTLKAEPVTGMRGWGTHNQPPGTWSDDTSLMLCLLEHLQYDLDLNAVAESFVAWLNEGYMTPHGKVFDVGNATSKAIRRLAEGVAPEEAGGTGEHDNGNGSLMRILTIAFLRELSDEDATYLAHKVSRLTHRHPRSQMGCGLFVLMCRKLLEGLSPVEAYQSACKMGRLIYESNPFSAELPHYNRFLSADIGDQPEEEIRSSGYVVHTLEAATWCLLRNTNFDSTVLTAVNLGEDTDTTAAVAGGMAGAAYGLGAIDRSWVKALANPHSLNKVLKKAIEALA